MAVMRAITIAGAILFAAATIASSFTPPSKSVVTTIRKYSKPDRLHVLPTVDSHCDIPDADLLNTIDGVLIRSRIESDPLSAWLIVDAICLRMSAERYAYHVEPKFRVYANGNLWVVDGTYLGVIGIANGSERILTAIKEQIEEAVTVYIYAHREPN